MVVCYHTYVRTLSVHKISSHHDLVPVSVCLPILLETAILIKLILGENNLLLDFYYFPRRAYIPTSSESGGKQPGWRTELLFLWALLFLQNYPAHFVLLYARKGWSISFSIWYSCAGRERTPVSGLHCSVAAAPCWLFERRLYSQILPKLPFSLSCSRTRTSISISLPFSPCVRAVCRLPD